jgi:hypothetical protein
MGGGTLGAGSSERLLTLGRLDRVSIQVGYRTRPDGPPHVQFLLDLPVPEPDPAGTPPLVDEARILAALERTLRAGGDTARHYSLHQHRWHTSWGPSPGVLEVGLLVTTGTRPTDAPDATPGVIAAFADLMDMVGRPAPTPISHDAALLRARRAVATAYSVDPDALSPRTGEHLDRSWRIGLRTPTGEGYDVVVGLVSGYAGSVLVRRDERTDVVDSVGTE